VVKVRPGDVLIVLDFRRYPKVNLRLSEIFKEVGGRIVVIGDSPISPSIKLADALFLVESKGVSLFDSYTAGFTLINSLLAAVTQRRGEYVRRRYEALEDYYSRFEIFSGDEGNTNISRLPVQEEPRKQEKP
jgi:DNA-binding MurR/RpiR family transcriptional regulator